MTVTIQADGIKDANCFKIGFSTSIVMVVIIIVTRNDLLPLNTNSIAHNKVVLKEGTHKIGSIGFVYHIYAYSILRMK